MSAAQLFRGEVTPMPSDSQYLVQKYFTDFVGKSDLELAEHILSPDCVFFSQDLNVPLRGIQANRQLVELLHAMLSDIGVTILALSGEGDQVIASVSIRGVRRFSSEGIPLRWEEVTWTHNWMFRTAGGRITEIRCYGDFFDFIGTPVPPRTYVLYPEVLSLGLG